MKPTFETIVKNYINLVYYFTRRWVKEENVVDDVVNETFLKVFKKYSTFQYQSEGEFKSWLLIICRNIIFDRQKKQKFVSFDNTIIDSVESSEDIESWLQAEMEREDVQRILSELERMSDEDNVIVRLRIFDELSFESIATILTISEAAAKMRFYRVISKLQKKLI